MQASQFKQEELLQRYDALIHRVLSDCYLSPQAIIYQDYYQELRLKLLSIAQDFTGDALGEDQYRFVAYARQGLRWFLLDLLRQQTPHTNISWEDYLVEDSAALLQQEEMSDNVRAFYQAASYRLTEQEWCVFRLLAMGAYSRQEIAALLSLSTKTISVYKRKIKDKLSDLKELLYQR